MASASREIPRPNPALLRWARERRGVSVDEAASRLKQPPERIQAWEANRDVPTVKQARDLADLYKIAFLELFLPEPPDLPQPILVPDFRMHRGEKQVHEEQGLKDVQAWAMAQRENALSLFAEVGDEPPDVPQALFSSLDTPPEVAARKAREIVPFSIADQLAIRSADKNKLPSLLRNAMEAIGILTLKKGELSDFRARGMCIAEFPLPVVVFGAEAPSAQAFTLAHELGHIVLRQSGVIAPMTYEKGKSQRNSEAWCDRFAASFLMPEGVIVDMLGAPSQRAPDEFPNDTLDWLAARFRVSRHAMLIRLVHLGYVAPAYYWTRMKPRFEQEEEDYQGFGRAAYYGVRYKNALGNLYTALVMEAWATGRITNHNAAEYMGIKNIEHLDAIRADVGVT